MNEKLIALLTRLYGLYSKIGDEYRAKAYHLAIENIKQLPYEISKSRMPDLGPNKIPGVGKGILSSISEFVETGRIRELDELESRPDVASYEIFGRISGVGPATIADWVKKKIYTLDDLRSAIARKKVALNRHQALGLKYYDDLNTRIPRAEVTAIVDQLRDCIIKPVKYIGEKNTVIFTVAGSYRRLAPTSGDIDILITTIEHINNFLQLVHKCCQKLSGYIDVMLAGEQRLTFLYKHTPAGKCRQIDLLYIPYESYYAALNYFTGSDNFNRELRRIAKSKGYLLNQTGLYKKTPSGMKIIPLDNEEDLFKVLRVPYVSPERRD